MKFETSSELRNYRISKHRKDVVGITEIVGGKCSKVSLGVSMLDFSFFSHRNLLFSFSVAVVMYRRQSVALNQMSFRRREAAASGAPAATKTSLPASSPASPTSNGSKASFKVWSTLFNFSCF